MTTTKQKSKLFGPKERRLLIDPLNDNNPITVQILGICSALAVTSLVYKAVVMAVAVMFVIALSNLITALVRNYIPSQVRMIAQLVIIATLVTIVELTLKANNYAIYKELSVFIGLIITNCIVMGRLEAFAMSNSPWRSFLDGIGNSLGYGIILVIVGIVRELFGRGTLFAGSPIQLNIIGKSNESVQYLIDTSHGWMSWYTNNGLLALPVSSLFIIGIIVWIQRSYNRKLVDVS